MPLLQYRQLKNPQRPPNPPWTCHTCQTTFPDSALPLFAERPFNNRLEHVKLRFDYNAWGTLAQEIMSTPVSDGLLLEATVVLMCVQVKDRYATIGAGLIKMLRRDVKDVDPAAAQYGEMVKETYREALPLIDVLCSQQKRDMVRRYIETGRY
ncbi:hypothetical protein HDV00_008403 [Rhizophlyctis rosea]|nr:hypothetical protein HDV00_008403 [Rhizophlyctis rosea]